LKESLGKLRIQNAILDGEIICIDGHGVSQFNQLFSRQGIPVFYAFDLLWLNHEDLRNHQLIERKERLRELIDRNKPERIIYAQHVQCEGKLLFEDVCNNDLEGIVAKRKHGIYKSNSIGWLKLKNPRYPGGGRAARVDDEGETMGKSPINPSGFGCLLLERPSPQVTVRSSNADYS
jgi:bifunctional non-homologous end joining protein LigD